MQGANVNSHMELFSQRHVFWLVSGPKLLLNMLIIRRMISPPSARCFKCLLLFVTSQQSGVVIQRSKLPAFNHFG